MVWPIHERSRHDCGNLMEETFSGLRETRMNPSRGMTINSPGAMVGCTIWMCSGLVNWFNGNC